MPITMTQAAVDYAKDHLQKRGKGVGLRLGVKTTGCSGMAYVVEYADNIEADDEVFDILGLQVVVHPKSLTYLEGMEVDFKKEGLNEGFKFSNPNEKARCGCGESFSV